MNQCHKSQSTKPSSSCHQEQGRLDYLLTFCLIVIVSAGGFYLSGMQMPLILPLAHAIIEIFLTMWWGILFGIIAIGAMHFIPREWFQSMLGQGGTFSGLIRAALAGVMLDLCSHGILMVGAKLYERGISIGQIITFLIASPWNSFSLTFILIALIGLPWTLVFIAASMLIAIITGALYMVFVKAGILPDNPHQVELFEGYDFKADVKEYFSNLKITPLSMVRVFIVGLKESRVLLRWLLLGVIIASAIRAYVPTETLVAYLGPGLLGLFLTLALTTVIEVCSEGSAPIGAELVTRAGAPGNGFTFLMAGVSTDYTEIMVLREVTKSWRLTLFLPLLTVPQILCLGWIMNTV